MVGAQHPAHSSQVRAEGRRLHRGPAWLTHLRERHVGQPHEQRGEQEADPVPHRSGEAREHPRGEDTAEQPPRAAEQARDREEPAAETHRHCATDDVHPGRHEQPARARDREQHRQRDGQGEAGRGARHEEGHRGQD